MTRNARYRSSAWFVALALFGLLSACGSAVETPTRFRGARTDLEVKVVRFVPYSTVDHYQKGRFEGHHTTVCEITAPPQYAGKALRIFHSKMPTEGTVWRAVGTRLRLVIAAEPFDGQWHIFRGAVERVTRVK